MPRRGNRLTMRRRGRSETLARSRGRFKFWRVRRNEKKGKTWMEAWVEHVRRNGKKRKDMDGRGWEGTIKIGSCLFHGGGCTWVRRAGRLWCGEKKKWPKGTSILLHCIQFFLFHRTFFHLLPDKWGYCEGYKDVFFGGKCFQLSWFFIV